MKENTKSKMIKKEGDRWINVHDDDVVREFGLIRYFKQSPRDKSVWTKTSNERRLLNNSKHICRKENMHFNTIPTKHVVVRAKLIIQLKSNKVFQKTTYSFDCSNLSIESILGRFTITNPKTGYMESVVAKYSYNGKTYAPEERPFFG